MIKRRIALGTAQFGLEYGISNAIGIVKKEEVTKILEYADSNGLNMLDTASGYGSSEEKIGESIRSGKNKFDIVTKLPNVANKEAIKATVYESLQKLGIPKLHGLLFHDEKTLKKNPHLWDEITSFKQKNLVSKIGVSLYFPDTIDWLLKHSIIPDIVQLPFNIFDQRFKDHFYELKSLGVEIHARSVFLQGLFFLKQFDPFFSKIMPKITRLKGLADDHQIPLEALLLNFVLNQTEIDYVVIGVTSRKELEKNIDSLRFFEDVQKLADELIGFKETDEGMILPFNWKL